MDRQTQNVPQAGAGLSRMERARLRTVRGLSRLARKMINHLCWNGFDDAERLLRSTVPARTPSDGENFDDNRPQPRTARAADPETTEAAFRIAGKNLPEDEILNCIQSWIKEDKSTFLKNALERMDTPLAELADALQRFRHGGVEERAVGVEIADVRVALRLLLEGGEQVAQRHSPHVANAEVLAFIGRMQPARKDHPGAVDCSQQLRALHALRIAWRAERIGGIFIL